jgi:uncharacterized membrane protein YraQ (UPF0718 family)
VLFRLLLRERLLLAARAQADRGVAGSMEGHAAMDMSVQRPVAHVFVMEWAAIIRDLIIGLIVAGGIAAWVPDRFWRSFFVVSHPLAAKLWGPLIAPILNIYRKYYGARMALFLLGTFYATMVAAGYVVELIFGSLGLVPDPARARIPDQGVSWDYTTWLNIVFLVLAGALAVRFVRTGGMAMLRMMGGSPGTGEHGHTDGHSSPSG